MSICCAFSFSLLSRVGVGIKSVCLAPLEDLTRALQFSFGSFALSDLGCVVCWPWPSCLEYPALDQEPEGQALSAMAW